MALYSLFIECRGVGSFGTQARANTPRDAVCKFLKTAALYEFLAVEGKRLQKKLSQAETYGKFSDEDILLCIPMDGLVNMHLCQLGRNGEYVTIITALTMPR